MRRSLTEQLNPSEISTDTQSSSDMSSENSDLIVALEALKITVQTDELITELDALCEAFGEEEITVDANEQSDRKFKVLMWAIYAASQKEITTDLLAKLLDSYHTISVSLLSDALTVETSTANRGKRESKYGALQYALYLGSPAVIALLLSYYDKVVVREIEVVEASSDVCLSPKLHQSSSMLGDEKVEKIATPTTMNELNTYFEKINKKKEASVAVSPSVKKTSEVTLAHEAVSNKDFIMRCIDRKDGNSVALLIRYTENPINTLKENGITYLKRAADNFDLDMLSALSALYLQYTDLDAWQTTLSQSDINIEALAAACHARVLGEEQKYQQAVTAKYREAEQLLQEKKTLEMQEKEKRQKILSSNKHWLLLSQIKMGNSTSLGILIEEYKKLSDGLLLDALFQNNAEALQLAIQIKNIDILFTTMAAYFYVEFQQENLGFVAHALSQLPLNQLKNLLTLCDSSQLENQKLLLIQVSTLSALRVTPENSVVITDALCANNHAALNYAIKDGRNLIALLEIYDSVISGDDVHKCRIGKSFCENNFGAVLSLLAALKGNLAVEKKLANALYQLVITTIRFIEDDDAMKLLEQKTREHHAFHVALVKAVPQLSVSRPSQAGVFARSIGNVLKKHAPEIAVAAIAVATGYMRNTA